jgi:hypothetical protein
MDERVSLNVAREFAAMAYKPNMVGYSMTAAELKSLRRFLRANRKVHSECEHWLNHFKNFVPSDKPDSDGFTLDDYATGYVFGAFCRQLLAMKGIVVVTGEG